METRDAVLKQALAHHLNGDLVAAESLYRRILARDPGQPMALRMLGVLLMDAPDSTAAEAVLRRHLAVEPDNPTTLHNLGRLLQGRGRDRDAVALLCRAVAGLPGLAPISNDLAVSLHRLGRRDEALAALDHAVAVDPGYAIAHDNRGLVLRDCRRFAEAAQAHRSALALLPPEAWDDRRSVLLHYARAVFESGDLAEAERACRSVLDRDATNVDAAEQLAEILDYAGRDDEARALRNGLARSQGLVRKGRAEAEATVLLVAGVGASHVPTRYLIDPERFRILALTLVSPDQSDAPLGGVAPEALAGAEIMFNTLGEVERDGGHPAAIKALARSLGVPLLNPPERVARTGRDQARVLFGDIPGLLVPGTRRMNRSEPPRLDSFAGPQLIRPGGAHGGKDLVRIDNDDDLARYLGDVVHRRFILTDFHDFRSADGHYRKYRFIFVDGRPFAYHLAIGESWLVHYWRAEMGRDEWKMREEEAFLNDWRRVFGPAGHVIDEVARRLDLDYGGLDCAMLGDGRVLFFEANASMLVHLDDSEDEFAYKHRAVPPIREAVTAMVMARRGRGRLTA